MKYVYCLVKNVVSVVVLSVFVSMVLCLDMMLKYMSVMLIFVRLCVVYIRCV